MRVSQTKEAEWGKKKGVGKEDRIYLKNSWEVELTTLVLEWNLMGNKIMGFL